MIGREIIILIGASILFASAVAGYLAAFHNDVSVKEVVSTAFAAVIGLYCGRFVERKLRHG
ncbi:MAG: hypothetical protein ABJO01_00455 [Parasphingorhabdus sp.]|uniref:hypothetical protein n=1 Tax=Parasphingorhabdus sp. TaxID=2709688 RepID=UPI0032996CE4